MDYKDRFINGVGTGRYFDYRDPEAKFWTVQISNTLPKGFKTDDICRDVFPGGLAWDFKRYKMTEDEYTERYRKQLYVWHNMIQLEFEWFRERAHGKPIVLLCWELEGQFCHRHILLDYLIQSGIIVSERDTTELER